LSVYYNNNNYYYYSYMKKAMNIMEQTATYTTLGCFKINCLIVNN